MDNMRKRELLRKIVQVGWGVLQNAHFSGFVTGKIYSGSLKRFCVPGMNCYACPGALGACPIGALQAMYSGRRASFPFFVLGFLMLFGVLAGRFICGWLCLFGLIQEVLYRIPVKKIAIPTKLDRCLRYLKYGFLAVFVLLLPNILRNEMGVSAPYFCKLVCPVGMLEGGIPLLALNESMRQAAHLLYAWKFGILVVLLAASVFIHRPFCKYICPLGAFYALFRRISFLRLKLDERACVHCGACARVCRMQVDPSSAPDSAECIRCGECISACPGKALSFGAADRMRKKNTRGGEI